MATSRSDRRSAPSAEELAAIVAAVEACLSSPPPEAPPPAEPPPWRFSGRWWAKPVAARRERPWS